MSELVTAIGLVFVIEGTLYAVVPGRLKQIARLASEISDDVLRVAGLAAVGGGLVIVWLARTML